MSELTLLLLRVAFLALLWIFVFIVIYALRSDLFGTRLTRLQQQGASASASASAAPSAAPEAATTVTHVRRGSRAASGPARRLVVTGGPKSGLEMDLPETGLTIGRAAGSGLQVKDDYTSSNHARLVRRGDDWLLEDLQSTNGTFVDGRRIQSPTVAAPGTTLRIGTTTFELRR